jgi:hypothetical protein
LPIVESILPDLTLAKLVALENALGLNITSGIANADLWCRAVICTDMRGSAYGKSLADFAGTIHELEQESFLAGEVRAAGLFPCSGWPISSDYRFAGTPASVLEIYLPC